MKKRPRKSDIKDIDGNKCGHVTTNRDRAIENKLKHEKKMEGIKTILVKHPILPNCMIERIVK